MYINIRRYKQIYATIANIDSGFDFGGQRPRADQKQMGSPVLARGVLADCIEQIYIYRERETYIYIYIYIHTYIYIYIYTHQIIRDK